MTEINEIDITVNLFIAIYLAAFPTSKLLELGLNSLEDINLGVACKCSSATRKLRIDLSALMDEKNCLHWLMLLNIVIILAIAESHFKNLSREKNK